MMNLGKTAFERKYGGAADKDKDIDGAGSSVTGCW